MILDEMIARRQHLGRGMRVDIVDIMPRLSCLSHPTFLGGFAWTSKAGKYRYLLNTSLINYTHDIVVTPGDAARDYLHVKYKRASAISKKQIAHFRDVKRSAPLFAKVATDFDGVYVDIKSAYWSIILRAGWDVDYMPGGWLVKRSDNSDFPFPQHKLARNILVTAGLPTVTTLYVPETREFHQIRSNDLPNWQIYALCMDVLNAIADEVLRSCSTCIYVNTDGFILNASEVERVGEIIESWGLRWGVKEAGETRVWGAGDYDIGKRKSRRKRYTPHPFHKIQVVGDPRWLKKRFRLLPDLT